MISIVTVILNRLQPYLDIFIESIFNRLKHISEIIIVNVEKDQSYLNQWFENGINFKLMGGAQQLFKTESPVEFCSQHAFGLHLGLEHVTNEYVMFSDPDIFFNSDVDEYYLNLMNDKKINFIGICGPAALCHGIMFFPTVLNCLVKKSDLPPNEFSQDVCPLKEMLNAKHELPAYLHPMVTNLMSKETTLEFPNPTGHYETGARLFLWSKQQNWRWMSFQTTDQNNYYKNLYRNNFGFKVKLPKEALLYHESLSSGFKDKINCFTNAYKKTKEE